jgi:uncharacterized protein (TIGR03435 family)
MKPIHTLWPGAIVACAFSAASISAAQITVIQGGGAPATASSADQGRLEFEVASVKPNKSGDGRVMLGMAPGGRFTATNVTLRMLIRNAYQLQDFQIAGGPNWLNSDHFDIVAKADRDVAPAQPGGPPGPLQMMLRALLADRFKLAAHNETRDMPIYALVLARSDGKLGPQLHPSATDCAAIMAANRARGGPPAFPEAARPPCGMRMGPGQMSGGAFPLSQLASTLSVIVQRVVIDRSGLTGAYDFDLTWTPDQTLQGQPPPGAPAPPPIDPNGPSIFTALQEQLGLKLDSQRGPVDVLVIDKAEPPTPD